MSGIGIGLAAAGIAAGTAAIVKGSKQKKEGKRQRAQAFNLQIDQMKNEAIAAEGGLAPTTLGMINATDQNLQDIQNTGANVLSGYKQMAQEGLPEEAYLAQQEAIDRGASMGVQYLQGSRAGIRGIGNLAQSTTDAYRQLNAMDAQARLQNRQNYLAQQMNVQNQINQSRGQFGLAQQQEALRQQGLMYNLYGAGIQNIVGGIESQGQGAAQIGMGVGYGINAANNAGAFGGGGGSAGGSGGGAGGAAGGGGNFPPNMGGYDMESLENKWG